MKFYIATFKGNVSVRSTFPVPLVESSTRNSKSGSSASAPVRKKLNANSNVAKVIFLTALMLDSNPAKARYKFCVEK